MRDGGGPRPWYLAVALLPIAIFAPAWTGRRGLAPGDGYFQYIPWYTLSADAWARGRLPAWNPFPFAGAPLLAAGQAGVFHPPNLLFAVFGTAVADGLVLTWSYTVAVVGAALLARHVGADRAGAVVGGVAFGLSTFFFARIAHQSVLATTAWLPWILLTLDRARQRPGVRPVAAAAVCVALATFAGHLHLLAFVLGFVTIHLALVTVLEWRATGWRPVARAGGALALGLGLAAIQLVPTLRYLPHTARSAVTYEQAVTYALPPSHLPVAIFPGLFGGGIGGGDWGGAWNPTEMTFGAGAAVLVAAAVGIGALRRDRRLLALAIVAGAALVVALGPATPVAPLIHRLPIAGQFRAWARYAVGWDLLISVLAALGVSRWRTAPAPVRRPALMAMGVVTGSALLSITWEPVRRHLPPDGASAVDLGLAVIAAAVVAGLLALVRRPKPLVVAVAVAATAVAPIAFGLALLQDVDSPTPATMARDRGSGLAFWGRVTDRPGGIDRFLFIGSDITPVVEDSPGRTDFKGMRSANGNDPLTPKDYAEAVGAMTAFGGTTAPERLWSADSAVLDLLRITTVLVDTQSSGAGPPAGGRLVGGEAVTDPAAAGRLVRYEHEPALADAFLVGRARAVDRAGALRALHGLDGPVDVAAEAPVEGDCRACPTGAPGSAGTVLGVVFDHDEVRATVRTDRPALLVVSQAWLPGWRATVDGQDAPVVRVAGLVQGVPVPAGARTVVLRYVPPGLLSGAAISALTLLGLVCWAAVERVRRIPDPPAPSQEDR